MMVGGRRCGLRCGSSYVNPLYATCSKPRSVEPVTKSSKSSSLVSSAPNRSIKSRTSICNPVTRLGRAEPTWTISILVVAQGSTGRLLVARLHACPRAVYTAATIDRHTNYTTKMRDRDDWPADDPQDRLSNGYWYPLN